MIQITGMAQHQASLDKTMPPHERISEHVWSIPVRCDPFPVRYTLSYSLAGDAGDFVIVDPGWDSAPGREQLAEGLAAAGLELSGLRGIIVTHFHPDHLGMARWLSEQTGAWVGMSPLDTLPEGGRFAGALEADRDWLRGCGVPESTIGEIAFTEGSIRAFGRPPRVDVALADGDRIGLPGRDIRVVWTPGHSAGHLCLVDHNDRLVLTGDHVLPRISPNIGLGFHDGDRDSVREYLDSLTTISQWDAYEVCPAHEWRFAGLGERCRELADHHDERSREVRAVLAEKPDATVWEVAQRLSWSRGWANLDASGIRGALGETVAHLRYLGVGV